ncbi:energy-coupling factor transporter ATPase [Risungbinella massiliensis]|uniref:energy-coupling factor transporter ATPase n=1 Tax=Risungbinella massiliensis TaxID=1329796 RepID=UPI0005CC8801|nr:energy-coupling factor transporter ATPase [Risungbinella massiliensis]
MKPILEVQDLKHTYMINTPLEQQSLSGVTMEIQEGECVAIIGHTGSGKSTLIQHFNGLYRPQEGKLVVDDQDLSDPKLDLKKLRSKVGLVFQNPEDQLFEKLIGDDVAYGPLQMGLPLKEVRDHVKWAMEMVGLSFDDLKDRPTYALSGGQKRKVALAGVLAMRPKILILDEPTAGLDPHSRKELLKRIELLNKKEKLTIIFVSHNMDEVAYLADKIFVMADGKNVIQGTPQDIFGSKEMISKHLIHTPVTVEMLYQLQTLGYPVDVTAFEVESAASEIVSILPKRGGD